MLKDSELPTEAYQEMHKNFEGLTPVISEGDLLEIGEHNPEIMPLIDTFLKYAERYANDVWSMHEFVNQGKLETEEGAAEFAEMDTARTRLHNALVDSIAILSRALAKTDIDNSWVRDLTNGSTLDRSACGSFALLLIYRRYLDQEG